MKIPIQLTQIVQGCGLAVATVVMAGLTTVSQANAQSLGGDDGIAASPKLRAQLNERQAGMNVASPAVPSMACPKCKDVWVEQTDKDSRGFSGARALTGQTTRLVAQHLCDGCSTEWSIAGTGRAKHSVATHKCTGCGAENLVCCGQKGGNIATKGMEQQPQVAPLK
jgi:hypothetical protein